MHLAHSNNGAPGLDGGKPCRQPAYLKCLFFLGTPNRPRRLASVQGSHEAGPPSFK